MSVSEKASVPSMALTSTTTSIAHKYVSWDRKMARWLTLGESVMFSSIYSQVQENSFRMKYALVGVLIDFIQVFGFTLSEDFGWGSDFDVISTFLQGPIGLMTWPVYATLFWITVVILASAFVISYYVGYSFAISDFRRMWPIRFLRTVSNALLTILYIPVLTILLVLFKSNAAGYIRYFVADGIKVWAPDIMPYSVISILLICIFVPYCLLLSLLNFEFASNTKDIMARHSAWLDFIYLILKTILVFVTHLVPSSIMFRAAVLIVSALFVSIYVIIYVPYYMSWVNTLRSALFWAQLGATISAIMRVAAPSVFTGISGGVVLVLHIGVGAVFGLVGVFVMRLRLGGLLKRESLYTYISQRPAQRSERSSEMGPPSTPVRMRHRTSNASSSIPMRPVNRRSFQSPTVGGNTTAAAPAKSGALGFGLFRTLVNFHRATMCVCRTFFLQADGGSDDLVHLADTVFQRSIDVFPDSSAGLCLHYANFLMSFKHDWIAALAQLRKARTKKLGFLQRWQAYTLNERIDREKRAHRIGGGSVDLMKYVEFQHGLQIARRHHLSNLRHLRTFWETLLHEDSDKRLLKMSTAQTKASNAQARALYAFSRLLSSFPNSPLLWRSYGSFLSDTGEEEEGAAAFQAADSIEERVTTVRKPVLEEALQGSLAAIPEETEEEVTIEVEGGAAVDAPVPVERRSMHSDDQSSAADHKTATTGKSSNTSQGSSLLLGGMSHKATHKLHLRFAQAIFVIFVVFVGNNVASSFLINIEDEALNANWDVIQCRMDTIIGTVAVQDLALSYYVNNTLSLDQTSWTLLPNGVSGHAKVANDLFDDLKTRVDRLLGQSRSFGYGVDTVWDTAKSEIKTFPDKATTMMGLKGSIDAWLWSLYRTIDVVQDGKIDPIDLWASGYLPYGLVNGISGLGDTWDHLSAAYEGALASASEMLLIIVLCIMGGAILLAAALSLVIIRPRLMEVHLDEHLSHAMMTAIPPNEIGAVVKKLYKQEAELTSQLLETETREEDQLPEGYAEASTAVKRKYGRDSRSLANLEVRMHQTAKRHASKCKEMRPLTYKYLAGLFLVLLLLIGQTIEVISVLQQDVAISKIINYSAERIDKVGDTYALCHFLPETIRHFYDDVWGQNLVKGINKKAGQLIEYHNYATFGAPNDNITIAYSFIKQHQAKLFATFDPLVYQYVEDVRLLAAQNVSTMNYAHKSYAAIHKMWNQPGELKIPLEQANKQYYDQIAIENAALKTHATLWLAGQIVALFLAYIFALRPIVHELQEKSDSVERMLKMVPAKVLAKVPVIAGYLKDRTTFLERVREKAAQESAIDELDDTWASMFVENTNDAYIVISRTGEIIHYNASAMKLFVMPNRTEMLREKVEVLITPAYRAQLSSALNTATHRLGVPVHAVLMGACRDKENTFLADVRITSISVGKRQLLSTRDHLTVMMWTKSNDTRPPAAQGVSAAAEAPSSSMGSAADVLWDGVPVMVLSLSGMVIDANDKARTLIVSNAPLQDTKFVSLFDASSQTGAETLLREALVSSTHRAVRQLTVVSTTSGQRTTIKATAVATRFRAVEDVQHIVVTLEDLSDVLAIQHSLQYHENLERTLMTAMPTGVVTVSQNDGGDGDVTMVNPEACTMFGYTADSLAGQPVSVLFVDGEPAWRGLKTSGQWKKVPMKRQDGTSAVMSVLVRDAGSSMTLMFVSKPDSPERVTTTTTAQHSVLSPVGAPAVLSPSQSQVNF